MTTDDELDGLLNALGEAPPPKPPGWHMHYETWTGEVVMRDDSCTSSECGDRVLVLPLDGLEETIAREVVAHQVRFTVFQQRVIIVCTCGDELIPTTSSGVATYDDHRAHLAQHVARALRNHGGGE